MAVFALLLVCLQLFPSQTVNASGIPVSAESSPTINQDNENEPKTMETSVKLTSSVTALITTVSKTEHHLSDQSPINPIKVSTETVQATITTDLEPIISTTAMATTIPYPMITERGLIKEGDPEASSLVAPAVAVTIDSRSLSNLVTVGP